MKRLWYYGNFLLPLFSRTLPFRSWTVYTLVAVPSSLCSAQHTPTPYFWVRYLPANLPTPLIARKGQPTNGPQLPFRRIPTTCIFVLTLVREGAGPGLPRQQWLANRSPTLSTPIGATTTVKLNATESFVLSTCLLSHVIVPILLVLPCTVNLFPFLPN